VADVVASSAVELVSSNQSPPVQGGSGNLFSKYRIAGSLVGSTRGIGAVDWQQYRDSTAYVANGTQCTIGGGRNNTASGYYTTIAGGSGNNTSLRWSAVGGGLQNTASNYGATVAGGLNNNCTGNASTVGGGSANTASGYYGYACVAGGQNNTASGYQGRSFVGGWKSNTASANYATVGGGFSNTASSNYATVSGGRVNTASGNYGAIGGGQSHNASATFATVAGGYFCIASLACATVGGGRENTASANYATIVVGHNALASRTGMTAYANGFFSAQGDAQAVEFIARNTTTGATTSVLRLDGGGVGSRFTIRNNTVLSGICTISGFSTDGVKVGLYQRSISIKNVAGTTTLVHSSTISTDHEDDATWNVTITGDNATDSLNIACLGSAGDTVRWVAVFRGLEIAMP